MAVSLDIALSMQTALQNKMAVLSNNAANMGAVGFQADTVIFEQYLGQSDQYETFAYANDVATLRDLKVGSQDKTGNPFHMALSAEGYFGVITPQGPRYTRSGAFTVNDQGILVDLAGNPVMSADGGQIAIPVDATDVIISNDGVMADQNGQFAQVGIFDFDNPQDMEKLGDTLLKTDQAPIPLGDDARVVQGALEQANVNPILNMVEMTQVTKLYAANQRYIEESLKLQSKQTDMLVTMPPAA